MRIQSKPYGVVSWWERVRTVFVLLPLPLLTLYRLVISRILPSERHKPWKRVLTDTSFRYISSSLNVHQMQNIMGTTVDVYKKWAISNSMPAIIDELDDDARLLWFGERQTENIIFYIHGGTYCLPLQDFAASFWKYAMENLRNHTDKKIGFVALNYSIRHLLSIGVKAENIQIVGESAGGALILQLFSHLLHPVPDVPVLPEGIQFAGACIMSPWVSITGDTGSHIVNSGSDVLPAYTWTYLGSQSLPSVSQTSQPYLEALKAPEGWFEGIDKLVKRIFLTVGEKECLRDDVLEVAKKISANQDDGSFFTTAVQKNGVHNDQYLDFMAKVPPGELISQIIHWLKDGITA